MNEQPELRVVRADEETFEETVPVGPEVQPVVASSSPLGKVSAALSAAAARVAEADRAARDARRPGPWRKRAALGGLVLAVAIGAWWAGSRFSGAEGAGVPPLSSNSVDGGSVQSAGSDAQNLAVRYETAVQLQDPGKACALDAEPTLCRAGFAENSPPNVLIEPVTVVASEQIKAGALRGDAVQVQWQAQGQPRLQSAMLVRDGKILRRVTISSKLSGLPLTSVLGVTR